MEIPDELGMITPFLSRAAELKTREPIISYYCSFYAAQLALSSNAKSANCQSFLLNLLDELEKIKADLSVEYEDIMTNDLVGFAHVSNFALKVFISADNEDRSGKSSRKTAKTFLAASLFMEVLSVFGDLEPDIVEKIKYSKFKATEIIKALKSGKTPTPGGPLDQDIQAKDETKNQEIAISPLHDDQSPLVAKQDLGQDLARAQDSKEEIYMPESGLDYKTIHQAQKFAKFAISALQYDDVNNAIENLTSALNLLQSNKDKSNKD